MKLKKKTKQQRRQSRKQRRQQRLLANAVSSFVCVDTAGSVDLLAAEGSSEEGQPRIRRFEMVAYNGGKLHVRAFPHPAVVDLESLKATRSNYPSHLDHQQNQRVGHTTDVIVKDGKIKATGLISAANSHAEEVVQSGDNGFPWQSSIGISFDKSKVTFVRQGLTASVNGRTFEGPIYVVRNSTLNEISFVSVGGDEDGATARVAASASQSLGENAMGFEAWLQAQGWNVDELSEGQRSTLEAAYEAQLDEGGESNEGGSGSQSGGTQTVQANAGGTATLEAELAEGRQLRADEVNRVRRIRELCAEYDDPSMQINSQDVSLEAHAIQEGWDGNQLELECMRLSRGSASVQTQSHSGSCTIEAMQGAVMVAGGVPLDWDGFGTMQAHHMGLPAWTNRSINDDHRQQIMEAAHHFSEMHSLDICREAIRLDGRMVPSGRSNVIQAAMSGSSLTNIWTTNVNARLLMKFREAGDSTVGWCSERDVNDFRLNDGIRVEKGGTLTKHSRGGSAEHHSGSDTKESYRIARYSKQFFRDEMDIIDNRLMAGNDVIDEMAKGAVRLRPDLVYAILMGNPDMADGVALFHSSRNNIDVTGALMDDTHLKEAITRMALQMENGVNLNLTPTHLVTAATMSFDARGLIRSTETRAAAAAGGPTINTLEGAVANLVSDSRIDNGVVDPDTKTTIAGDSTAFFLISNQGPTIEVGYLNGTGRAPSVTTWKKTGEDGVWGVGASVKMDVGSKAMASQTMQKLSD